MAVTYEKIATNTLGSAAASVTFSSISSAYTDLVLIMNSSPTSGIPEISIQVNTDTGSNYSSTVVTGSGSVASSARQTSTTSSRIGYNAVSSGNFAQNAIVNFMNYANTTTYKTFLSRGNNANYGSEATVGLWRSTSAINSVTVLLASSTFIAGSTFTLYGIKAA